jgi:ferredoxin
MFLGYRLLEGHPVPHLFRRDRLEELEAFVVSPTRYPLEKLAMEILAAEPEGRLGLLARECTGRALRVLSVLQQVDLERIELLPVACCPSPLHPNVTCSYVEPSETRVGKEKLGIDGGVDLEAMERMDGEERFERWMYEFEKCLKCYGCRDICPVCVCKDCSLHNTDLIEGGWLPVEVPLFHLVRAVHMAGRCIDCGLCEEACPVEIPLRLLYRNVTAIVKDLFDSDAGISTGTLPLGLMGDEEIRRLTAHQVA